MDEFRIAAAQVAIRRGEFERNVHVHAEAISAAARFAVTVLVFPELSLTGYEPERAALDAISSSDARLKVLEDLAGGHQMHVVAGAPLLNEGFKPHLGAILFGPDGTRRTYFKMHLGGDEPLHFTPGSSPLAFESQGEWIGLSICADSSKPTHPQTYAAMGASVYAAGVFLNDEWFTTDSPRLAEYALRHKMLVVMANHGASIGTIKSVGRSAVWAPDGTCLAQTNGTENALVISTRQSNSWRARVQAL